MKKPKIPFPKTGSNKEQLLSSLEKYRSKDIDWRKGKAFCLVYYPGDERAQLIKSIYDEFYAENALNPSATPTLTRMESEVVSMCADLFNGDNNVRGNITSGGTESILLAVKTARDWAKEHKPQLKNLLQHMLLVQHMLHLFQVHHMLLLQHKFLILMKQHYLQVFQLLHMLQL